MYVFDIFIKNKVFLSLGTLGPQFYSIVFVLCYCHGAVTTMALIFKLTSGMVVLVAVFSLLRIVLGIWGLYAFLGILRLPFNLCEELHWNFYGNCIKYIDCF